MDNLQEIDLSVVSKNVVEAVSTPRPEGKYQVDTSMAQVTNTGSNETWFPIILNSKQRSWSKYKSCINSSRRGSEKTKNHKNCIRIIGSDDLGNFCFGYD